MMTRRLLVLALVATSACDRVQSDDASPITAAELSARLRFFSSDRFEGRLPGTRGDSLAVEWLVSELGSFGVEPAGTEAWLQPVSIVVHDADPDSPNEARVSGRVSRPLAHGRDLRLANHGASARVETGGELVFVGYGIDAPAYGWNDLEGLDLEGKVAIGLFGEPKLEGDSVRFNGFRASRYSWTRDKADDLSNRGAVGVLWVLPSGSLSSGPVTGSRRLLAEAEASQLQFTGNLTDSALAALLPTDGPGLAELVAQAGRPGFRARPLGSRLDVRFRTRPRTVQTRNVVGVVGGTDAALSAEHVVLSAHWDAYGIGRPVDGDSIYNGALDDGSGVTALLALARVFAAAPEPRSITFLFTTAEEWGLLGAEAFVREGPLPLDRIVANLNVDDGTELFGPKRDVAPLGIELSSLGATVALVAGEMGLRVTPDPFPEEGFFLRADNYPFARGGVPALYMALGTDAVGRPEGWTDGRVKEYIERQYHRPSDDYETVVVDIEGARQLAEFTRRVTSAVARAPEGPAWLPGAEFSRPPAH
ncbi:MAG: M28 family peptidase [Gemmatimonadales bacterium]